MALRGLNRALTAGERALLEQVFGGALEMDAVRVCAGRFLPFQAAWVAMSPNGNMYFPPASLYCDDFSATVLRRRALFVHEAVHVWQRQLGYPVLLCGVCLALQGGYWRSRAYRYRDLLGRGVRFSQLNMEQQAAAVEDYFYALWCGGGADRDLCDLLRPFLDNPFDVKLLPESMWLGFSGSLKDGS